MSDRSILSFRLPLRLRALSPVAATQVLGSPDYFGSPSKWILLARWVTRRRKRPHQRLYPPLLPQAGPGAFRTAWGKVEKGMRKTSQKRLF